MKPIEAISREVQQQIRPQDEVQPDFKRMLELVSSQFSEVCLELQGLEADMAQQLIHMQELELRLEHALEKHR